MKYIRGVAVRSLMLCIFFSGLVELQAQTHTARKVSMTANTNGYYEYLPQGYTSSTESYPVIIFLHGMGELGNGNADLPKLLNAGIPRVIQQGQFPTSFSVNNQTHRVIVISPQWVKWPKPIDINGVIDYVVSHYRVNQKKIYVTGLSMGGGATWEYVGDVALYNKRIAAVVPICGASWPDVGRANRIADALLPVWATHNNGDPTVPLSYTDLYIQNILKRNAGALVKKTIFSSTSHDAWSKTYDPSFRESGKNVYEWMLQYETRASTTNQPPVSRAGADVSITLPSNSVVLDGRSSSDPDGTIAGYLWSKVSGPAQFTFSNASANNPTVSNLVAGQYIFRLRITDNKGATANDDVTVTVNATAPANKIPVANAGADISISLPSNSISLSGSGTDSDGQIVKYSWTKTAGPSQYSISNTGTSSTTVNNLAAGQYTFRLQVTDDKGGVGYDDVIATVNSAPLPGGGTKKINVNISSPTLPYNNSEWNNWNVGTQAASAATSGNFKYSNGTASSISARLNAAGTIADNGASYGSGMVPAEVLRHTSYSTVRRTLTISGLSPSLKYNIELYAARSSNATSTTVFLIGTASQTVTTYNNKTQKAVFSNLTANAQGQVTVTIERRGTYNYLNGFSIIENGGTTAMANRTGTTLSEAESFSSSNAAAALSVSPNPIKETFVLSLNNTYRGPVIVRVVNTGGKIVQQFRLVKGLDRVNQTYILPAGLVSGNYSIVVVQGKSVETVKVIKL